eukprot:CAMPEP_0173272702 /NCGR_PEP_ID=MMETSP1143-20121109/1504_1 /TAXON_ID=483371 /ORGANISM="non described non described, Strain CCMP2298" /LENGTH=141 /DNA_ID=CAMNT_0014209377 /DNA_START=1117 /DNA_END=1538 /DNA_ORIENTATION=-
MEGTCLKAVCGAALMSALEKSFLSLALSLVCPKSTKKLRCLPLRKKTSMALSRRRKRRMYMADTEDSTQRLLRMRLCLTRFTAALSSLCPSSGSKEEQKNISLPLNDRLPQKLPEAVMRITLCSSRAGPLPTLLVPEWQGP